MCIIFFALSPPAIGERKYRFIMAANREEYYNRPSQTLSYWSGGESGILGGRDMEPGRGNGTWLAINTDNGNFSALTNYRTSRKFRGMKSRGLLVSEYLTSPATALDYTNQNFLEKHDQFGLSSLLVGNISRTPSLVYSTNAETAVCAGGLQYEEITGGIHGLTNKTLNYPWAKIVTGKDLFSQVVEDYSEPKELITKLQGVLSNDETHHPDPNVDPMGFEDDWINPMSAIHVRNMKYNCGTKSSAVILVEENGNGWFHERSLKQTDGSTDFIWEEKYVNFKLPN